MRDSSVGSYIGALLLALAGPACGDDGGADSGLLLARANGWERVANVADDVFGAERPMDLVCDEVLGMGVEEIDGQEALEINTDACSFLTVSQPSLRALVVGDAVSIRIVHEQLDAEMAAQASIALAIEGAVTWQTTVPIPSADGAIDDQFAVDRDLDAGAELQFHVHNHGPNTYYLLELAVLSDGTGG